jgi:hypothetical protein
LELKYIESGHSDKERLMSINPNFGTGAIEYIRNCGNCAVANELRHKGYDVEARPSLGLHIDELAEMFDGATVQRASTLSATDVVSEMIPKVERDILAWGDGTRGAIRGEWIDSDDGHIFSFEVRGGSVKYDDGQTGEDNVKYLEDMKAQSVKYVRLDNLKPNDKVLNSVKNKES